MKRREFNKHLFYTSVAAALPAPQTMSGLRVNGRRINLLPLQLSEFGKNPQGGVSRMAYSEADRQGREFALSLLREAKLQVSIDAAGNLVGRRAGRK